MSKAAQAHGNNTHLSAFQITADDGLLRLRQGTNFAFIRRFLLNCRHSMARNLTIKYA